MIIIYARIFEYTFLSAKCQTFYKNCYVYQKVYDKHILNIYIPFKNQLNMYRVMILTVFVCVHIVYKNPQNLCEDGLRCVR